jgi:hypothetical protein
MSSDPLMSCLGAVLGSPLCSECWQLTDSLDYSLTLFESESESYGLMLRPTVSRPVCLGIKHPSGAYDQILFFLSEYVWQLCSWFRGAPSLTRGRVCLLYVPLTLASAVFPGPSPLELATVFYCLRFETSLFVASYDSQGHGGSIRPRLHTVMTLFMSECSLILIFPYRIEDTLSQGSCFPC